MTTIVAAYGSAETTVPASQKIAVFSYTPVSIYQQVGFPNIPAAWELIETTSAGEEYVSAAFSAATLVRIETSSASALFVTGADPSISEPIGDITAVATPFTVTGLSAAQGGSVSLVGGTSSTSANAGGASGVLGGQAGATGVGGAATLVGAVGGATSGVGGAATVAGGAGSAGNSAGGVASVTGGAGQGSAAGGVSKTVGGAGGATGAGGAAQLTGGAGGATSGTGGAATIVAGAGSGGNAVGGAASLTGGAGQGTGAGGATSVVGGASGAGATGTGANVSITGGASLATDGNGGAVIITGGALAGTGIAGAVINRGTLQLQKQAAPVAEADADGSLTAAEMINGICVHTVSTGRTMTTPTGAALSAAIPNLAVGDSFEFTLITVGTGADDISTLTAGDGAVTFVGKVTVGPDTAAIANYGTWRFRNTGAGTWVGYRKG